jgi:hypothetical protein
MSLVDECFSAAGAAATSPLSPLALAPFPLPPPPLTQDYFRNRRKVSQKLPAT